jgi:acetyl-CoA C-acetyltransferase/acetyl-CoA acyltransferase
MTQQFLEDVFICGAVRTAGGRTGGALSAWHPADLGGAVIDGLLERSGMNPAGVDDVIFGCVSQIGPQTFNVARTSVMSSSLPDSVPGVTVDRQCGSSQQAAHFAAQAVASGTQDVVIAGGVESMSTVPISSAMTIGMSAGMPSPFAGRVISERYPGEEFSQFVGAERVGRKYGVSRNELVEFAIASHLRAQAATDAGRFAEEILSLTVTREDGTRAEHVVDEGIRPPNREKILSLPSLVEGGLINAAMASQIADGASAVLIANRRGIDTFGLTPLAAIRSLSVIGSDPEMVLEGPIPATQRLFERTDMKIDQVDLYEVNEAFGTVPLAWSRALGADPQKLNVNGGAQALGHPLGATGTKLIGTLVYEMRRRGNRFGVVAICEGLGTANATLIEAL